MIQNDEKYVEQQTLNTFDLTQQKLLQINAITKTGQLRISRSPRPNIIKQISHIYFPHITNLNFNNSHINNIELIRYLSCPHLVTLELYGNKISNFDPLVLNNQMPKLTTITFYKNPLKCKWRIERLLMPCLKSFQFQQSHDCNCTIQDISFIVKKENVNVGKIMRSRKNRISQQKLFKVLKNIGYKQNHF